MKTVSNRTKVGISVGDINGIGIEVILKTFSDKRIFDFCTPVVFASRKVIDMHKRALNLDLATFSIDHIQKAQSNKLNILNVWQKDVELDMGKETSQGGKYALASLKSAVNALKEEKIDVLITAPINKHNIQSDEFQFNGHTEYLASNLEGDSLMILMCEALRIGLITGHIPVQEIANAITPALIEKKVRLMQESLVKDFNIAKPKIAILGLNPHCGDHGVIGKEDEEVVKPTLEKLQEQGNLVYGPYAADSFFGNKTFQNFDGILAMYHDQGLGPFKTIAFGNGVNFTAGLNKIRTSPDHGTAFEIAGKGVANHNSFKEALYAAVDIYKARSRYEALQENKLIITR